MQEALGWAGSERGPQGRSGWMRSLMMFPFMPFGAFQIPPIFWVMGLTEKFTKKSIGGTRDPQSPHGPQMRLWSALLSQGDFRSSQLTLP